MATYEQCLSVLHARCTTKDLMHAFCKQYKGTYLSGSWTTDQQFIDANIKDIVDLAERRGELDKLGRYLGIPSNAEQERLARISQGVFAKGEEFDGYYIVRSIFANAQETIALIDGYIDDTIIAMLTCKQSSVIISILTKAPKVETSIKISAAKFNSQYGKLSIRTSNSFHDRFIIIDKRVVYSSGHSFKDIGKAVSMLSTLEPANKDKVINQFDTAWTSATVMVAG